MLKLAALVATCSIIIDASRNATPDNSNRLNKVLVISFDGISLHYFSKGYLQVLGYMASRGTKARWRPVFPSKTFTNHHSMATGLYAETHGLLGNYMFGEDTNVYNMKNPGPMFQYVPDVIPIWILNELTGEGRYSGVIGWAGSDQLYLDSRKPTFHSPWKAYGSSLSSIHTIVKWFTHEQTPANLVMLYADEPDTCAHYTGTTSTLTMTQLETADAFLLDLYFELDMAGLVDQVDIIIVSDHGMVNFTKERIIDIDEIIGDQTWFKITDETPVQSVKPVPGKEEIVYEKLVKASEEIGHFKVYKQEDIPDEWHFKNNRRNDGTFLLVAELYWGFKLRRFDPLLHRPGDDDDIVSEYGTHGYDPKHEEMQTIFAAIGPNFREGYQHKPTLETIALFPLLMALLDLNPPPDHVRPNATVDAIKDLLLESSIPKRYATYDRKLSPLEGGIGGLSHPHARTEKIASRDCQSASLSICKERSFDGQSEKLSVDNGVPKKRYRSPIREWMIPMFLKRYMCRIAILDMTLELPTITGAISFVTTYIAKKWSVKFEFP